MSANTNEYFLSNHMTKSEHMKKRCKHVPDGIRKQCQLDAKVTKDGCICIKIKKGMPCFKQAAMLAYQHLKQCLEPYGYEPMPRTTGLWRHKSRPTIFCLCVDDFGINFWNRHDADHSCNAIGANFQHAVDEEEKNHCGLTITCDFKQGHVDVSMPKCVPTTLKKLMHIPKVQPQHSPHMHIPTQHGKKGQQQMENNEQCACLPTSKIKEIQSATGCFLYYARAIDNTMLHGINEISTTQAKPTEYT